LEVEKAMHVFIVGNGALAAFGAVLFVGVIIKLAKKIGAEEAAAERKPTGTTIMDSETGKTRNVKPGDFI
jgi:hypothetical protein